jgi:hypothetical protein
VAKKKKGGKTPESYKIDFTGVESGGRARYPEGDYIAKITKIEPGQNDDGDKKYLAVTFEFTEGKFAGKTVKEFYHITPKALFRLKNLLEVLGLTVPSRVVNLPLKKMIGKEIGITVADDEYDNKIKSVVSDTIDPEVVRSGGVDDDEDVLEDDDEEEDDEDDEDEEDLDDLDRAGLKAYIKENELDVKVTKKMKDPAIRKAILAAQEEEGDDEEEDDDEMEEVDLEGL